jgi:hypothetical protein
MRNHLCCWSIALVGALTIGCSHHTKDDHATFGPNPTWPPVAKVPNWVEAPEWALDDQGAIRIPTGLESTVMVSSKLIEWTGESAIESKLTSERYAVLSDLLANEMIDQLLASESGSVLTSPKAITSQGQSAWVGIFTQGEGQESGTVFFIEPTDITPDGAELRYSFQMLRRPNENGRAESRVTRTMRADGAARLGVGNWLVQELKGDAASESKRALFIQVERVDIPQQNATMVGEMRAGG